MKYYLFLIATYFLINNNCYAQRTYNPIDWTVADIVDTQLTGTSEVILVTCTSSKNISNATVFIDESIVSFVTVVPDSFAILPNMTDPYIKQNSINLLVSINVPNNIISKTFEGKIYIKTRDILLNNPLSITLTVVQPGEIPPENEFLIPSEDRIVTDPISGGEYISDELLLGFNEGYGPDDIPYLDQYAYVVAHDTLLDQYQLRCNTSPENLYSLLLSDNKIRVVAFHTLVEQFSPVYPGGAMFDSWDENNPQGNNYHFEMCQFPSAWFYSKGNINFKVGVIDGGFYTLHQDLQTRVNKICTSHNDIPYSIGNGDHGTRVSGIIGADGRNGTIGIAGAMWDSGLYLYNPWVVPAQPILLTAYVTRMLKKALLEDGVKAVNMSLGRNWTPGSVLFSSDTAMYADAIRSVIKSGNSNFLIVCAAGNQGIDASLVPPGCLSLEFPQVINVASVNENFNLETSSNFGGAITVAAPGKNIFSTANPNTYLSASGTSFAAPLVTGLIGLLWSTDPSMTAMAVRNFIITGSINSGHQVLGHNFYVINALESFELLIGLPTNYWQQTNGPNGENIQTLEFDNTGNLYAGCLNAGGMFRSIDSGNSWTQINNGLPPYPWLISLVTNSNGHLFVSANGVYRSTNSGTSWILCNNGLGNSTGYLAINAIGHLFVATNAGIYRSTNNGDNWSLISNSPQGAIGLAVSPWGHLFATVYEPTRSIYRSTDNGNTWTQSTIGLTNAYYLRRIVFNSAGYIFVSSDPGGGVYRSMDNGNTWVQVTSGMNFTGIYSLAINSIGHLFAGTIPYPYGGGVYRSTNNGTSWTKVNTGLFDITPLQGSVGAMSLAIDINGFLYAGTFGAGVFKTRLSTISNTFVPEKYESEYLITSEVNFLDYYSEGIYLGMDNFHKIKASNENTLPDDYCIFQNYPNPFNPTTKIKYDLSENNFVTLKVFDILGREVVELVNDVKPVGSYEVEFNASNLPSGIYFYRLQAGSFVETKKMVLMK